MSWFLFRRPNISPEIVFLSCATLSRFKCELHFGAIPIFLWNVLQLQNSRNTDAVSMPSDCSAKIKPEQIRLCEDVHHVIQRL